MRTTAVLVILLLAVSLNLGASMALAGENAVIQPLPSACQSVSDAELSQIQGKFNGMDGYVKSFFCQVAYCFWENKVPIKFKTSCLGQKIQTRLFSFCNIQNGDGDFIE